MKTITIIHRGELYILVLTIGDDWSCELMASPFLGAIQDRAMLLCCFAEARYYQRVIEETSVR